MATGCEQRLNDLKRRQAVRLSRLYDELSLNVSNSLYKRNVLFQKSSEGQKIIARQIEIFRQKLYNHLQNEISEAFRLSNICVDKGVREYTKELTLSKRDKSLLFSRNLSAVSSFMVRKTNGLNLSDRVWKVGHSAQTQINALIEEGLLTGRSARSSASDLKTFLKEPDKRFRRVRDKKTGKLVESKPSRNYKSGRGVYKSSYKNALRLSRNEINIAYRSAELERYRRLPFVTGYKVNLSNSHPVYDICDELQGKYPKNFTFVGWHPNCLCFVTPIQLSKKDFKAYLTAKHTVGIKDANALQNLPFIRDKYTTSTPSGMGSWLRANADKVKGWKNTPYWIKDNFDPTNTGFLLKKGIGALGFKPTVLPKPITPTPKPIPKPKPKQKPKKITPNPNKNQFPEFLPKEILAYEKKLKLKLDKTVFSLLKKETPLNPKTIRGYKLKLKQGAYYQPNYNFVRIPAGKRAKASPWHAESVVYHEYGHAVDWHTGMRGSKRVEDLMQKYINKYSKNDNKIFKELDKKLRDWDTDILNKPFNQFRHDQRDGINKAYSSYKLSKADEDLREQIWSFLDTIMSLDQRFGGGHNVGYMSVKSKRQAEFIAHSFENKFIGNPVIKELAPDLYKDMIKLIDDVIKQELN